MHVSMDSDTKKDHILIARAISALESTALNFSARAIPDAAARLQYMQSTYSYSKELLDDFHQGKLTAKQAAEQAQQMRNVIMEAARKKSCEVAKAYAVKQKPTGMSLTALQEKYAKKIYGKKFDQLSKGAKNVVWKEIVVKSGAPQARANMIAKRLGKAGRGLLFLTITVSVYNVLTAEDKARALSKDSAVLSSGLLGSVAGGAAAGCACGPGAPVCVSIGAFLGGVLFAVGADYTFDYFWR